MKAPFLMLIAGVIFFASCTKTDVAPPNNSVSANSTDDAAILKTRSALLTAHPWKYQGFYFHYVDKNNKGDVQYQRGGSTNLIDLDATRYYFKPDGTFAEIDGGYRFNGTWHFTDNTAAVLFLDFKTWTETCTMVDFTSGHLNYTEPMGYHALSFTELIPAR
jgi:hypothetical protein